MRELKIERMLTQRGTLVDKYLRDINNMPLISPEEEAELSERIRRGDDDALQRLVNANLRFVVSVAKRYQSTGVQLVDLISEGNIGLITAARRFDPTRGFKFISYAVWWIRQSILQSITDNSRTVRLPLNEVGLVGHIKDASLAFEQKNGREPTDDELSELVGFCGERVSEARAVSARQTSLDAPLADEGDKTMLDYICDEVARDELLERESMRIDIEDAMKVLTDKERTILKMSFGIGCEEMLPDDVAEKMGISRERVRQIRQRALKKLSESRARRLLLKYM